MSNTPAIGKHSMNFVHRIVKRRKRAGARIRGNANRRVVDLKHTPTHEKSLHFTKGKRSKARQNFAHTLNFVRHGI